MNPTKLQYFIKDNLYLIIPMICFSIWALLYLIQVNFILHQPWDFIHYYNYGKYIFIDPKNIYNEYPDSYYFMPSFALSFGISISLIPLFKAHYVFYIINMIVLFYLYLNLTKF